MSETALPDRPKVIEFRSDHSPTVIYACSLCGFAVQGNTQEQAERCCLCIRCGKQVDRRFRTMCDACEREDWRAKAEARREKAMSRPAVEHDGPVFVEDNDRYYETPDEAAEALWDDGSDPITALAVPCTVSKAAVPDIASWVDEAWGESFDEGWDGLDKASLDVIDTCVKALTDLAPVVWVPMTGKRVQLPAVEASGGLREQETSQ